MLKNYNNFLNSSTDKPLNEAKVKPKIERSDLKIGDRVMTNGEHDKVDLDYKSGKIIFMREYGNILIEFDNKFSKELHSGHKDIGKEGHCFYVPLSNITSNDPEEFEKIIKKAEEEKNNKDKRLAEKYKAGDVIVGIGKYKKGYPTTGIDIDGQIGVIFYQDGHDKDAKDLIYWVSFLDKFDPNLKTDGYGIPKNGAGYHVDKIHMRPIEPDEIQEGIKDRIDKIKAEVKSLGETYDPNEIVIVNGKAYGLDFKNEIGVVRQAINTGHKFNKNYIIHFTGQINPNLYDVNYMIGGPYGYQVPNTVIRRATPEEIEPNKDKIKSIFDQIEIYNHEYKVGDYIVAKSNNTGFDMDGQIGVIYSISGTKPSENFGVSFLVKFNDYLRDYGSHKNCYNLIRSNLNPIEGTKGEDLKKQIENKEILPYQSSPILNTLLNRSEVKIKVAFSNMSYFDITKENDVITYMPLDKFKRLEKGDDPYKSRFRQQMKIGKFFRVLNNKLTDKEVEKYINSYKTNHDICVTGLSDKLKLVSGEDIRFWYNGKNYKKGGGTLNGSCMQGDNKGKEMQMFVDNPDTIQMLTLIDPSDGKLLGRALVWRLIVPSGKTYMDNVYTRFDKDKELFKMYADQHGWLSYGGGRVGEIVCALNSKHKYKMGVDALDHFDTVSLRHDNLISNCNVSGMKNPYWESGEAKDKPKEPPKDARFKPGDRVIYKKEGSAYNNKGGEFLNVRESDGKYLVRFDDVAKRFAANPIHLSPENKEV